MADQDFKCIPGKWYVSFVGSPPMPGQQPASKPPAGGPFDTEQEARQWLAGKMNITGANVWQCPDDDEEDVDDLMTDAGLADRQAKIDKLVEQGAVWNPDTQTYSIGDRQFDADGEAI